MSFSFKKLDVNIMVKQKDASEFVKAEENEINFNNASITTGDGIFDGIGIENNANMTGYVRVKVNYSGENTDAQKTAIALNSVLPTSVTYEDSTNGYAWTYSNGYFYLVNANNKENVKEMNNDLNINYILFNDTFKMVDLTQFGNNLSTNGVSLQIKAEAVQSSNLQYTDKGETKNVESVEDLEKAINVSNIFQPYTEAGYIVKYDTCGGVSVDSYICLNSESKVATLPQVGGVNVTWYKDKNFTQPVNSTAEESVSGKSYTVTNNITLYAKYSGNNNTIKVFFNLNGGEENSTPSIQDVTKGNEATEIEIDKTPTKLGYKLSGWKVGKDGATTYVVNDSKISVKNSEITTKAITLYAVWETLEDISVATVSVGDKIYDGTNGLSSLTVTYNGKTLTPNIDYTATTYNIDVTDEAKVIVTGKGDYTGTAIGTYKIAPKELTIEGITAQNRIANGDRVVTVSGGAFNGVIGSESVSFELLPATVDTANAGAGKLVTVKAILKGDDYVIKNYNLTQPSGITVTILRASITFNANGLGLFTGATTLYGEYGTKDLYDASVDGTKVAVPTFSLSTEYNINYTFNGYWSSSTGGVQMVSKDYELIDIFTSTANVTWYAQAKYNFKFGTITRHINDTEYKMSARDTFNFGEKANNVYTHVELGTYPQTFYSTSNSGLTDTGTTYTLYNNASSGVGNKAYKVYKDSSGNKYVEITTVRSRNSSYVYSNGTTIGSTTAYFKLEPIIWEILGVTNVDGTIKAGGYDGKTAGVKLFLSSVNILTSMKFSSSSTSYTDSTNVIKPYLNGTFFSNAFTSEEQVQIAGTDLIVGMSRGPLSIGTNDATTYSIGDNKVFLLSYEDLTNTNYFANSTARIKWPTDYAGANYAYRSSTANYGGYWWSRSAYSGSYVWFVDYAGGVPFDEDFGQSFGVVPALFLSIE